MKQALFLILFCIISISICQAQQAHPDTVYVLFDTTSTETCTVDVEGEGYQEVSKFLKENIENYLIFYICSEELVFVKNEASSDTLSSAKAFDRIPRDIDYLINVYKNTKPKKFKHNVFDAIYLIEKISDNKYVK